MLFESGALYIAVKEFNTLRGSTRWITAVRHSKNPAVFTVLFEDTAALLGLLIAFIGLVLAQYLELPWLDGAASIGIGVLLAFTAMFLAYETKALLIGEAASDVLRIGVQEIVAKAHSSARSMNCAPCIWGRKTSCWRSASTFHDHLNAGQVEESIYHSGNGDQITVSRDHPPFHRGAVAVAPRRSGRRRRQQAQT